MIFTIGHSQHRVERFVELLRCNDVTCVVDVRSVPYSKFAPQFNKDQLEGALKVAGIGYSFLGIELGARRSELETYVGGKARYEFIALTPRFQQGLHRLREEMQGQRVALMCAEKDPVTCHRAILVCRHLRLMGVAITHLLEDGRTETQSEMEERLLKLTGVGGEDLFCNRSQAIERAYEIQGERIAYSRSSNEPNSEVTEIEHEYFHNRVH